MLTSMSNMTSERGTCSPEKYVGPTYSFSHARALPLFVPNLCTFLGREAGHEIVGEVAKTLIDCDWTGSCP